MEISTYTTIHTSITYQEQGLHTEVYKKWPVEVYKKIESKLDKKKNVQPAIFSNLA